MCAADMHAALEWRLLASTLVGGSTAQDESSINSAAASAELGPLSCAVGLVESGRFLDALASPLASSVLPAPDGGEGTPAGEAAAAYFDAVRAAAEAHAARGGTRGALEVLCVGVAALQAVAQANVTGPTLWPSVPACPGTLAHGGGGDLAGWDEWAVQELSADGEEVIGKTALPQYLVLARVLLLDTQRAPLDEGDDLALMTLDDVRASIAADAPGERPTACWWAARCALLQQRLLARGAVSLRRSMVASFARTLARYASPAVITSGSRPERCAAGAALLEAALMEFEYHRVEAAAALHSRACAALRLRHAVVGAMGMRTVYQQDAKAQMVLRWALDPEADGTLEAGLPMPALPLTGQPHKPVDASTAAAAPSVASMVGEAAEESDVLHAPQLVRPGIAQQADAAAAVDADELAATWLPPLESAAVLVGALCVRKGRASDELRAWEMAPFIEAVRCQPAGAPLVRAAADLLAARHERTRGRTAARALAGLEGLVQALWPPPPHGGAGHAPTAQGRARLAWVAWLPPAASLRREWGEQLLGAGLVGAAMSEFQALELWDALVLCLQLAGKRAEAAALVRRRLEVTPGEARLWCALGDVTEEEEHYATAWRVSSGRSARAQRCLARAAARRQDWVACSSAWRLALGVNSLHADGWFALGFAEMQQGKDTAALAAFSRVTQQEPSHAEAWNNVAALSLRCGNKAAALSALHECVRHRRDDWRLWDNMAVIAAECCEWSTAAHAATRLLALSQGKRVPPLDVMTALTAAARDQGPHSLLAAQVGDVLRGACASGCGGSAGPSAAGLWDLNAQLRAAAGEHTAAGECLARRLRALQGTAWDSEAEAFQAYADACADLAAGALQCGTTHELAATRLQLRGTLKRVAERFGEHPAYGRLTALLDQVEARRDALKTDALTE